MITVRKTIHQLAKNPKKIFLIDSMGALLTAFLLFVVLKDFNEYIGMPKSTLIYLALIAIGFSIYSTACFFFLKQDWAPFIKGIGIANLLYCILTIGLLVVNSPFITILGLFYFLLEIVIICILVYTELKVAIAVNKK